MGFSWGGAAAGGLIGGAGGALAGGLFGGGGGSGQPQFGGMPAFNEATNAPEISQLRNTLSGLKLPGDMATPAPLTSYQAKDMSGPLPEYQQMRDMAQSQNSTAKGEANDAVQRRYAAMGMQNSGSAIKQTENINNQYAQQGQAAQNQIGLHEAETRRGLQQQEAQKEFQSGESTKQFNANREFQVNSLNQQNQYKNAAFTFDANSKIAGMDQAARMANDQHSIDLYNQAMNGYQMKHSGGLLGSGGFLGTGIGGGMGGSTGIGI